MNNVNLMGRLCAAPEIKTTSDGKSVCRVSLAVDRIRGGTKSAEFFPLVLWDKQAENLARYCRKGDQIGVTGAINPTEYEQNGVKHKGFNISVNSWDFGAKAAREKPEFDPQPGEDDLPF